MQFHNLLCPIISSIFAGNGIIGKFYFIEYFKVCEITRNTVKGSENTAWSSRYFISIVKGALEACGHNSDLVQVIYSSLMYLTASSVDICYVSLLHVGLRWLRISHLTLEYPI